MPRFVCAGAAEVPAGSDFDLVLTFDCLHDMTRPDQSLEAIRGDGALRSAANVNLGRVTHPAVAEAFELEYTAAEEAVRGA